MDYKNLLVETKDNIAIVTLNRPDKLNALNFDTFAELKHLFLKLQKDDNVYVVIVTGAGEKAFVAGADISELTKQDCLSGKQFAETGQEVFNLIENLGKPVIAAVNGFALGGGCELTLACYIRLASERAKFGQPEVNLGIIPGYGGTQRLANIINPGRAAEYILTADMMNAEEALRIGLVSKVFTPEELLPKAKEMAMKIATKGQISVRLALQAIQKTNELTEKEGQAYEAALFGVCCGTDDFKEGTTAFLEKRKPEFKNK
ncbi:MAG: enoyl-CoA hydratase/isomerase family protein [Bacteroidetes bacterium]|nr:enoyl-CoA hydratase/isomerase family protein [Bacteroidota bacterium]